MAELHDRRWGPRARPRRWRGRARRAAVTSALAAALVLSWREASAQLHWDASAQVGVMKRFLVERPPGSGDAGFGPAAQLTGHVALIPLVHLGAYAGYDLSPSSGAASPRHIASGGARVKGAFPLLGRGWRTWAFFGFGYAGMYARSYSTTLSLRGGGGGVEPRLARVEGAGGGFFEVPFGVGVSYKVRPPWSLSAELGSRVGFGHVGSAYREPGPRATIPGYPDQSAAPAGLDRMAITLMVGLELAP